jgi:deoxyribonuclease V
LIAALDAAYRGDTGLAAAILFEAWDDRVPARIATATAPAGAYEPGAFYKRELPALLAAIAVFGAAPSAVVIDGYVWLDGGAPGLGGHLFSALGGTTPVIGVAKTRLRGDDWSIPVARGRSARPLYITAAGMDSSTAAAWIAAMHGPARIPTLLRRADGEARALAAAAR